MPVERKDQEVSGMRKDGESRSGLRLAFGLNTIAGTLLLAALLVMVNYLSYRHYVRGDWSRAHMYRLSDKTMTLLKSLTNDVRVVVFFQPGQDIYDDVENLMKEYKYVTPHLRVEWVDPDRDLARAEELARKYDVDQANVVVFDCGGRTKYVSAADMVEYDYSAMQFGRAPEKKGFKGEQAFSSAIMSVTQARKPVVYFTSGHGERDIEDYDRRKGYSGITREIRRDNIDVRTLSLGEKHAVPKDCDALIIAGPTKRFSDADLEMIDDYLGNNGRLLVMLESYVDTGLKKVLRKWGVKIGDDIVVDATRTLTGRELFLTEYGDHAITRKLQGVTSIFYMPRSVLPLEKDGAAEGGADKPHVTVLASSSQHGWAETDLEQETMRFDAGSDIPGPVSVAVAVEKGSAGGIDVQIRPTRLVVFGDADFVSNGALTGGDLDFFMNALNWLLERKELLAISAKPIEKVRLLLTRHDLAMLFWLTVVIMPAAVGLAGLLIWWRRRE